METVALVAGETGTLKATEGVRAVREYITGSVLALVLVCKTYSHSLETFIVAGLQRRRRET